MDFDLLDQNESETQGNAIRYKSELKKNVADVKKKIRWVFQTDPIKLLDVICLPYCIDVFPTASIFASENHSF